MANNEGTSIQLQMEHSYTNSLLYNNQKYPINFDVFKFCSKYFFEHRNEIHENSDISLESHDPDDTMKFSSPEEVIEFIKYIQFKPIQLTNDNIFALHHMGQKYRIDQLIASTEEYISEHEDEVLLKFLHRKEIQGSGDLSFYEDKIASNFSVYVNNDDITSLDISTLYRILEKAMKNGWSEVNSTSTKDFLMKVLDERGRPASVLFKFADISAFDDEALTRLLTKHSQSFEFEFIAPAVLNAYLGVKEEHKKQEEESAKKYEAVAKEHQAQKDINEKMSATLENERQKHRKYEEESNRKYEAILKELQAQKDINDGMNKQLLKSQVEKEQLQEKQKADTREHDSLCRELDDLKKQLMSIRSRAKDDEDECDGFISVCKYSENMIISNNMSKTQVDKLVKYLIKEKDKHQQKRETADNFQEIVFLKRKQVTAKDKSDASSCTEEDIFISSDMIDIMYENGTLTSIELQKELKGFPCIYFDLRYPTRNFESIYREIIQIKQHLGNRMKISIFYEGEKDTDQRFHNNDEISHLRLGKSVRNIKSSGNNGSFEGCSSLTSVSIPSSVTSIGEYAFSGCSSLTSVSIPSSVTSIGDSAFSECSSLTSVSIPSSVASIGKYAFDECPKLNDIKVIPFKEKQINYLENKFLVLKSDARSDIYDILLWVNPNNEIINIPGFIKTIGSSAFNGCSSLTSVSIPSSVTSIGSSAFYGCSSLTSVSIPSSVTSIGEGAFYRCSSLTSVSIPSSVTSIGEWAFSGCSSLTSVSIPSSVTSIGFSAFSECSSLTSVSIPSSLNIRSAGFSQNVKISRI